MPILDQYMFGPLTYVDLFSVMGIAILCWNGRKMQISSRHCWIVAYILYTCFITFVTSSMIDSTSVGNICLRMIKFVLISLNLFFIAPQLFEFEFAFKFYTKVIIVVSSIFFLQYILYFAFHQYVVFLLPGLPLNYDGGMVSSDYIEHSIDKVAGGYFFRPRSVFIEPAFYSTYCLPWLSIAIYKKKQHLMAMIVTLSVILSTSTTGIIVSALLWVYYFILNVDFSCNKVKTGLFLIVAALLVMTFSDTSNITDSLLMKQKELNNLSQTGSLTLRLFRGWECFKSIDFLHELLGCGYGNLNAYFSEQGIKTMYDYFNIKLDYMNGLFLMLCSIGIVGAVLNCCAIFSVIKNFSINLFPLLSVLFLLMSAASVWNAGPYYLCLILLLSDFDVSNSFYKKCGLSGLNDGAL